MEPLHPNTPPPPYPGPNPLYTSAFAIPSFDSVEGLSEFEATGCLPTYQGRPIRRYHPYLRPRPASRRNDESRFYNTIFDEEFVLLEFPPTPPSALVPVALAPPTATAAPIAPIAAAIATVNHADDATTADQVRALEEEHRRRVLWLWYVIFAFILAVSRALARDSQDAAAQAPAAATPEASSSTTTKH
ncbi:hypothetical protein C0991_008726 [Blastosporella zonata]|nr:hypothetical protein C0991_008726 [Blastosporella zonata]